MLKPLADSVYYGNPLQKPIHNTIVALQGALAVQYDANKSPLPTQMDTLSDLTSLVKFDLIVPYIPTNMQSAAQTATTAKSLYNDIFGLFSGSNYTANAQLTSTQINGIKSKMPFMIILLILTLNFLSTNNS